MKCVLFPVNFMACLVFSVIAVSPAAVTVFPRGAKACLSSKNL